MCGHIFLFLSGKEEAAPGRNLLLLLEKERTLCGRNFFPRPKKEENTVARNLLPLVEKEKLSFEHNFLPRLSAVLRPRSRKSGAINDFSVADGI